MSDLIQLLRQSLPEAIGGLIAAAALAVLGLLYRRWRRQQGEEPAPGKGEVAPAEQIHMGDVSGQVAIGEDITQAQNITFDHRYQKVGTQTNIAGKEKPPEKR
jgi:hypothetical protein